MQPFVASGVFSNLIPQLHTAPPALPQDTTIGMRGIEYPAATKKQGRENLHAMYASHDVATPTLYHVHVTTLFFKQLRRRLAFGERSIVHQTTFPRGPMNFDHETREALRSHGEVRMMAHIRVHLYARRREPPRQNALTAATPRPLRILFADQRS